MASPNDIALGMDHERAVKILQEMNEELKGSISNVDKLASSFGNNANYAQKLTDAVKNQSIPLKEIVALTQTSGEELLKNIQNREKELLLSSKNIEYLKSKNLLQGEDLEQAEKTIKYNSEQLELLKKQKQEALEISQNDAQNEARLDAILNKDTNRYASRLKAKQREVEIDKKQLKLLQDKAKAEFESTGEVSEETQQELDAQQRKVDADERSTQNFEKLGKAMSDAAKKIGAAMDQAFSKVESMFTQYQGTINARLSGTDKTFSSLNRLLSSNLSISMFVSQQKVLENVNKAVEAGIAYNIEERAFLQTVSENVASTFDAFDSNLLRIIRLQQSDSTAARLGLERELTTLFNQYFSDSSYMSDMYDSVVAELVEATSTMNRNQSVEFEAVAQKWLGALYSIGLSNNAVQGIASGINLLGSGNVEALAGNTQLQNLLAMSANRAGLDYGNLLITGFNGGSDLNDLMYSMVGYLAEIADSTAENNVVRSAYGNVFNLSMSDWQAISNMGSTLSSIYSTTIGYNQTTNSAQQGIYQMADLSKGIGLPAMLDNLMSNVMFGTMSTVVNNPVTYSMYKMVDTLEGLTGGIATPALSIFGNMVDLETTFERLAKTGIFGLGMTMNGISAVFNALSNPGSGLGWDISSWNGEEVNTRGAASTLTTTTGQSYSAQIGNASSEDMEDTLLSNATKDAKRQDKAKSGKEREEPEKDFDDLYYALFAPEAEAVLSTAGTSLTNINTEITTLNEEVRKAMNENAFNVNIKSFGGINMQSGIPVYFSGDTNSSGVKQMDGFISKFIQAFGINTDNTQDLEAYTLQDLVNFFIDTVGAEEGTGLNVNLAGNEVSATSFLTGQSGFERY